MMFGKDLWDNFEKLSQRIDRSLAWLGTARAASGPIERRRRFRNFMLAVLAMIEQTSLE
jgi:hypothetical protein